MCGKEGNTVIELRYLNCHSYNKYRGCGGGGGGWVETYEAIPFMVTICLCNL